jgi:negative regulator of sigma E activity
MIMKNTVSELIDQRVAPHDLADFIDQVAKDHGALGKWRNYHLIGDVIRGEVTSTGNCMMDRVQQALEAEPTVLAPVAEPVTNNIEVVRPSNIEALKSAGMFAVAASIVLMAVLTLSPGAPMAERDGSEIARNTVNGAPEVATTNLTEPGQQQAFETEFGQMLVEHGEFTAASGLNGLIAYAKLVSNENLE